MPAPPPARPLGRSLTPLPDESLPGFVLRLAHRLELPPARIAALTGLPAAGSCTRPLAHAMLTLDPPVAAGFAAVTRLHPEEAAELCMDRYASRYPALDLTTRGPVPRVMAISRRGWVLMDSTRYCPQCLAGDGSPIQQRHGGPWQQRWRLQAVFACPAHQRLLEHQCHQCGTPALLSRSGSNVTLLPWAAGKDLHPAQCRGRTSGPRQQPGPVICGARLDSPAASPGGITPPLPPELLQLQARILEKLEPAGPVPPASAREYFRLLALVHNLIMLSWPLARRLSGPEPFAAAASTHVATARQAVEQARAAAATRLTEINPPMRRLPLASDSSAGLLLAADRLLGWDDPAGLPDRLMPLTEAAALDPRAWYWLRTRPAWPPAVRRSFLPQLKGFAVPARRTGRPPISPRQCRFQPENVPQKLPVAWIDDHLAHLTGIGPRYLHRAAALKLVELSSGHAWSQAAELLHLPRRNAELAVASTRQWMRDDRNREAFDHAVEALAGELGAVCPHINYVIRRSALRTWAIPDAHWQGIARELETQTTHGRGRRHTVTQRRRQVISVLIWTRITQSEHIFAPAVIEDKAHATAPGTARLAAQCCEILRNNDSYTTLRTIITDYASDLADHIDLTGTTSRFNWSPPTPLTTQPAPRDQRRRHAQIRKPGS